MNKQELIKKYKELWKEHSPFHEPVPYTSMVELFLKELKQLDEPQKVTIPQFVADWIERSKQEKRNLRNALNNGGEKMRLWFLDQENYDLFGRAWLDGYEVEKEKRYTVKITKTDQYLHSRDNDFFFVTYVRPDDNPHNCHTRKELEEAGFGWVFDCEGIEIEEVEE